MNYQQTLYCIKLVDNAIQLKHTIETDPYKMYSKDTEDKISLPELIEFFEKRQSSQILTIGIYWIGFNLSLNYHSEEMEALDLTIDAESQSDKSKFFP